MPKEKVEQVLSKHLEPVEASRILSKIPELHLDVNKLNERAKDILKKDIVDCANWGFLKLDIMSCG